MGYNRLYLFFKKETVKKLVVLQERKNYVSLTLNYTPTGQAVSDFEIESFLEKMIEISKREGNQYQEFSTFEVFSRFVEWTEEGKVSATALYFQIHHVPVTVPLQEGVENLLRSTVFSL